MRRIKHRFAICSSETGEILSFADFKIMAVAKALRLALKHGGAYVCDASLTMRGLVIFEVFGRKHFEGVYGYDV